MTAVQPTMLAYLAGIIDGEGSICITEVAAKPPRWPNPGHRLIMSVAITDPEIPALLKEVFGGSIGTYNYNPEKHRPFTKWQLQGKRAADACRKLLPYLIIKRRQAELAIVFQGERFIVNPRRNGLTEHEIGARRDAMAKMKALNKKGPRVVV